MTKPNVAAILIAAQVLIIAAACKDKGKSAATIAVAAPATPSAEEGDSGVLPALAPPADASRDQLLINAAHNGDLAMVQKLLAEGADVNARSEIPRSEIPDSNRHGNSAFDEAMSRGRLDLAAYLLDHGADINATGANGIPALQNALFDPKTFDFLLARGANVNVRNSNGDLPLYYAVSFNDVDAVKKLLKAGADVNAADKRGEVPLHVVQNAPIARLLLAAGARPDLKDGSGRTPLMNIEWSVARMELDRAARLEEALHDFGGSYPLVWGPASDFEELKNKGLKGEMLAHRMNDLRTTEEKVLASELKAAGGK